MVSCTRLAKYSTAFCVISGPFSWNPYGVSSSTARGGTLPSRATMSRCGVTIVGAVSPEPMNARMRGAFTRRLARSGEEAVADGAVQDVGDPLGEFEVQVVVTRGEPNRLHLGALGQRLGLGAPLGVRALRVATVGQQQERRGLQRGPAHRRPVVPP